jgi:glycosyltransferase involved in cell wall biosynthesis
MRVGIVTTQFGTILKGGAEVQSENTIIYLKKLNIDILYILHTTTMNDLLSCDLVHFFKSDNYFSFLAAILVDQKIPYVVSSIFYPENKLSIIKNSFLSKLYNINYFKNYMKMTRFYLWDNACMIFPNTTDEANILISFGVISTKIHAVSNGIEEIYMNNYLKENIFLKEYPEFNDIKFILNVGRIEPRKRQLQLVKVCKKLNLPLVLIGNIRDDQYWNECLELDFDELFHIDFNDNKNFIIGAYRASTVFCLPSTMETPGLAALEAYSQGTQVVVTKFGGAFDYFKNSAYYVNPFDEDDIEKKLIQAIDKPLNHKIDHNIFSYENIALEYLSLYKKIKK